MQATPEFVIPTAGVLVALLLFAISIVYKFAALTDKTFPFQGESGFWYMLGRRGRMSKHQVIWEWIVLIVTFWGLILSILTFFEVLTNPTGLLFNIFGNTLYVISNGNVFVSMLYSVFLLILTWLMSGPDIPWG